MLHPKESSFTGGGYLVIRLPDSVQQSLKHRHSPALRFSLVFEGQQRRHIATCHLVDDSCLVSVIPEHKSCTESVQLLLYLHEPLSCRLILQQDFIFTATDPFDIVASTLLSLSVCCEFNFPLTWQALIECVDDECLPKSWSRDRLLAAIDSLRPASDGRLSASLQRIGSSENGSLLDNLKKESSQFEGHSTVLHFLATYGLISTSSVLLRLIGNETAWSVKNESGDLPADLADRAGFTEFALLLRCPQSIRKWVTASTEAQLRVTSGESVASISHPSLHHLVMTMNKEKSVFAIEQDVRIHRAVEDSEADAHANVCRRAALNGGVPESPTAYGMASDDLARLTGDADNFVFGDEPGESGTDHHRIDDESSQATINLLAHNSDTIDFVPLAAGADHPPGSPFVLRSETSTDGNITPTARNSLGGCTKEELVDDLEPTWSCTLKKENRSRYTRKYVKRQDLIWEMIATERNYIRMLLAIRDVYRDPFLQEFVHSPHTPTPTDPSFDANQAEQLFPCMDQLSSIHGALLHRLLEQQRLREDRAIHDLGDVLLTQFQGPQAEEMVHVYGDFYARHLQGKRLVVELKQIPRFAAFLARCESDSRIKRRTLDDIYLIINQRFSKLESLLVAIIENTINQADEAEKLVTAKKCLKDITLRAEEMLGESQNKEMLHNIVNKFVKGSPKDGIATDDVIKRSIFTLDDLKKQERRMVHYGKMGIARSAMKKDDLRSICKMGRVECTCLLFSDMFVLLQETPERKYKFLPVDGPAPSVLHFAYLSNCIVRESPQRHNSEFELYVIFNYANVSCRYSLYASRQDERTKWVKVLTDAAMNTELKTEEDEQTMNERLNSIDEKFKRGCEVLSLMHQTDWEVERLITMKASLWERYQEIWNIPIQTSNHESADKDEVDQDDIPNVEDIEGMMKLFSREATKLHMLIHSCNTNLTRSASSAADQAFTSAGGRGGSTASRRGNGVGGGLPRRYETFSGYDSSVAGKMTAGMYGKRTSLENATSDESVGTSEKSVTPNSAKSDITLKVKLPNPNNNTILRHPEGSTKNKDSSRRRSSAISSFNPFSKRAKSTSDKSQSETSKTPSNPPPPTSPTSPTSSIGTPSSLASPGENTAGNRLSSYWDWSNEYLEGVSRTPNRSVVQSLSTLNSETRRLIGTLSRLRTHLASMHNRLTRAELESRTLQSGTVPSVGMEASSGFHVVRETEKLRNQRAELERERTEFGRQRQKDIAKLETEREEILAKQDDLKRERESLNDAKERFDEAKEVLQKQIEQHERRGVTFNMSSDMESLLYPGGRISEEIATRPQSSTIRRDSGQGVRSTKTGSTSLLSLSQNTQRIDSTLQPFQHMNPAVSKSHNDLSTPTQPAVASGTQPPVHHMLPMKLADGEGGGDTLGKSRGLSGKSSSKSGKRSTGIGIFKRKS